MSRIGTAGSSAQVRWVRIRSGLALGDGQAFDGMHVGRSRTSRCGIDVSRMHLGPERGRRHADPMAWLDFEHRHLIMPLALWDLSEQIAAAALLFSRARDP